MILAEEFLSFMEPADCKLESIARSMFMITGSALRPVLAMAPVSQTDRMGQDFAEKYSQHVPGVCETGKPDGPGVKIRV